MSKRQAEKNHERDRENGKNMNVNINTGKTLAHREGRTRSLQMIPQST